MSCQPFWLRGDNAAPISTEQAKDIIARYRLLAARTTCTNQEDKLRALCPMLANIPVESHGELLRLVDHLSSRAQEPLDQVAVQILRGTRNSTLWTYQ